MDGLKLPFILDFLYPEKGGLVLVNTFGEKIGGVKYAK